MDYFKRYAVLCNVMLLLFLSQQWVSAQDEFNEFASLIYRKNLQGVKEFLAKGADVNMRQETSGTTPLMVACSMEGTEEIVAFLVSEGADIHIIGSYDGRTALMWAANNSEKSTELLLGKGARVDVKGVDGMTAFIQSIFGILSGSVTTAVCDLLIENGAGVNDQLTGPDATGWTPLMFACSNGQAELAAYLVSKGADVNLKAEDGTSALSLAVKEENEEIIRMLKARGAQE